MTRQLLIILVACVLLALQLGSIAPCFAPLQKPDRCSFLLGVFSTAGERQGRDTLRKLWKDSSRGGFGGCQVHPVFVLGKSAIDITSELSSFEDIIVLEETENMNDGKTFAWFKYSHHHLQNYTWVGKADMDTFLNLRALSIALATVPQQESYGGVLVNDFIRCGQYSFCPHGLPYFSGSFYFLSRDVISLIMERGFAEVRKKGPEDLQTGLWVRKLGTTIHYTKLYSHGKDVCKFKHPLKKTDDMLRHAEQCLLEERKAATDQ